MKKFLLSSLFLVTLSTFIFAQETVVAEESAAEVTEADSSELKKDGTGEFCSRAGVVFAVQGTTGDYSDFVGAHAGGGIQGEWDLDMLSPSFLQLGVSARVMFSKGFVKDDVILSAWNLQIAPGFYGRYRILNEKLILQPELSYGLQMNFLKNNPKYNNHLKKCYTDQFIGFALGVRYSPEKLLNGALEFAFTPFYICCPEKNTTATFCGANISVFFRF